MLGEWFRKVKEEEQEEVFYSCRMISIDVYFQEPRVKITQDTEGATQSYPLIIWRGPSQDTC